MMNTRGSLSIQLKVQIILFVMGAAMACSKQPVQLELKVVERAVQSGQAESILRLMVISTESKFAEIYRQIHAASFQKPSPPVIDFDQQHVLLAFMGQKSTAGYEIDFASSARQLDETLEVTVDLHTLSPTAVAAQIITSPYVLAVVEQGSYRIVRFIDKQNNSLAEIDVQ